jgi:hypothetical protein
MPPISLKKVLIALLIIVLLSRLGYILNYLQHISQLALEPLGNLSTEGRYVVVLLLLGLAYIAIIRRRNRRK